MANEFQSNPYIGEGDPKLRLSVVAFVDILGYRHLVQKANRRSGNAESLLRKLQQFVLFCPIVANYGEMRVTLMSFFPLLRKLGKSDGKKL
jgi:hypothetical protein